MLVYPFDVDPSKIEAAADDAFGQQDKLDVDRQMRSCSNKSSSTGINHSVEILMKDFKRVMKKDGWLNNKIIDFWLLW